MADSQLIQMKDGASEKDEPIVLPDANGKFHIYCKIKMIFFLILPREYLRFIKNPN